MRPRAATATRRERATAAAREYQQFLEERAIPAFRAIANVLRAKVSPSKSRRRSAACASWPTRGATTPSNSNSIPASILREPLLITVQSRGSRILRTERLVKEGSPISEISEDDLVELLLDQIKPWLG